MSLKDKINAMRNSLVVNMSKVVAENGDRRTIKNGTDKYSVQKEVTFEEHRQFYLGDPRQPCTDPTADSHQVSFTVVYNNTSDVEILTIQKRDNISGGDKRFPKCEVGWGKDAILGIKLDDNTDINNINSVRYQLGKVGGMKEGKAKQLAYFIDKFVIVTPEEREAYNKYAAEMDKRERDDLKVQKASERDQKRAQKDADKQARKKEKDKAVQVAAAERVKEKFFGRK